LVAGPEARIRLLGDLAEPVEGVTTAADRGVEVEEVAGGGAVAQRVNLAGHDVIRVQYRTDVHLDRWLDPPVGDQFHPVDLVGLARVGHLKPRDQLVPKLRLDLETVRSVRRDNRIGGGREIRTSVPVGEQVDVLARPRKDPMGRDSVAAGEGKAVWPADL
jgi:hypothetical protein